MNQANTLSTIDHFAKSKPKGSGQDEFQKPMDLFVSKNQNQKGFVGALDMMNLMQNQRHVPLININIYKSKNISETKNEENH